MDLSWLDEKTRVIASVWDFDALRIMEVRGALSGRYRYIERVERSLVCSMISFKTN